MKADLRTALSSGILLGDGAMGTYLYQLGFPIGVSNEEYNLTRPDAIIEVHRRYVQAGARLIETNTFSANREKMSKYGLENEVRAMNKAGAELARQAAGKDAYVVGAVGSIRSARRKTLERSDIERDLKEQMEALLEGGVDGLLLETFYELDELLSALKIARCLSNVPVICQLAVESGGMTQDGVAVTDAFRRLRADGADLVGLNCQSGPIGILRVLEKIPADERAPFSVYPNAGLPKYADGEYVYRATPEYFAETARQFADMGARIVGGCCGTTPEHIAAMAEALKGYVPSLTAGGTKAVPDHAVDGVPIKVVREPAVPAAPAESAKPAAQAPEAGAPSEPSIVDLVRERHTVIVEWDTPRDLSIERFMKGAAELQEAGADAITMADNSLAQSRMSNISLGHLVRDKLGARPLLHIACRDRNLIGTQSHLMGLHALGIDHVLVVTGDPAKVGDLPGASSVYDMTSMELIRSIKRMNEGTAFSGRPLKQKSRFIVGAAFDPNVKYLEKAIERMEKKIAAGADFFMTQPVYDSALIEKLHKMTRHISVPIFLGIMPVNSGRNTEFLHNEVPGIRISDDIRKRMAGLEGEEGRKMGVQISKELLDSALDLFKGIYLMTPMTFSGMTAELTRYVWEKTGRADSPLYRPTK